MNTRETVSHEIRNAKSVPVSVACALVSALVLAADIPWTCRIENHPADSAASSDGRFAASAPNFEAVAKVAQKSPAAPLDAVAKLRRTTPGISIDTDKRAGAIVIIR